MSPSHLSENFHLGYSIEPTCRRLPYVSPSQRLDPPQAYLLAKGADYLKAGPRFSWDLPFLASLQKSLGISVVAGMRESKGISDQFKQLGLTDVGIMNKVKFYEMLAMSFVMIGVGQPRISPSPWDALCMGTPVSAGSLCILIRCSEVGSVADTCLVAVHQPPLEMGRE